jgi:ribose-phosphate pyrophosphokinase
MLLLVNACRNVMRGVGLRLRIPYFPAARQDRVMTEGEPFALQVMANLIKSCNFYEIEVWDPHSDVLAGIFEPGVLLVKPQHELALKFLTKYEGSHKAALVSPDAGALKKIHKLAKALNLPVVEASKTRDVSTGEITGVSIPNHDYVDTYIIADDICDGGRTFIELGEVLRRLQPEAERVLYVTHGLFSKGKEVVEAVFDEILVYNDMSK